MQTWSTNKGAGGWLRKDVAPRRTSAAPLPRDGLGPGRGVWVTAADVEEDGLPVEEVDGDFVICPFRGEDAAVVLVESSTVGVPVGGRDAAAGVCILASGVDVAV